MSMEKYLQLISLLDLVSVALSDASSCPSADAMPVTSISTNISIGAAVGAFFAGVLVALVISFGISKISDRSSKLRSISPFVKTESTTTTTHLNKNLEPRCTTHVMEDERSGATPGGTECKNLG